MRRLKAICAGLISALLPSVALASYAGSGYRGIAAMYYTIIAVILIYGAYDTFGKRLGTHIGVGVIVIGIYLLIQQAPA